MESPHWGQDGAALLFPGTVFRKPGCVSMLCFANGLSVIVAVERALEAIFDASHSFEQSLPVSSAVYATRILEIL